MYCRWPRRCSRCNATFPEHILGRWQGISLSSVPGRRPASNSPAPNEPTGTPADPPISTQRQKASSAGGMQLQASHAFRSRQAFIVAQERLAKGIRAFCSIDSLRRVPTGVHRLP